MSQTTPFIEYANIGDVKVIAKYDLESYKQGKSDGAREFAEWLVDKGILGNRCIYNGEITDYGKVYLAEWQKGTENDNDRI